MTVEFGIMLTPGEIKGQPIGQWLDDLEASVGPLTGHIDSIWMSDHFFWQDSPTYEAWTVLTMIAARWPQFKVAPSVLSHGYRNPGLLAKMSATLQILTGGRFIMGIGAGWKANEYAAYNYPFPEPIIRLEQLEDTLQILRKLWTEPGPVTFQGKHYHVTDAIFEPKLKTPPPIVVGGGGRITKLLAAKYADGWNLSDQTIDTYNEHLVVLREHCDKIGRDLSTLQLSWLGRLSVAPTQAEAEGRALRLGFTHYKGWTLERAFVGTPDDVVERIAPFVEAGVEYFMFEIIGLPDPDVIGMVVEDVFPKIRAMKP